MDRKLIKTILLVLVIYLLSFIFYRYSLASWNCEPIYGGGEKCWGTGEILIDKTVKNHETGLYVDNLGVNDEKYAPGEDVPYRLEIKNTGQGNFSELKVKDTLPSYLDFVSLTDNDGNLYPSDWDSNTKELRFSFSNLNAGESRIFNLTARIYSKDSLPQGLTLECPLNYVFVEADGKTDSDQAQICFEQKVFGVTYLPPTGPEFGLVVSLGLLVTTLLGAKLAFNTKKAL